MNITEIPKQEQIEMAANYAGDILNACDELLGWLEKPKNTELLKEFFLDSDLVRNAVLDIHAKAQSLYQPLCLATSNIPNTEESRDIST